MVSSAGVVAFAIGLWSSSGLGVRLELHKPSHRRYSIPWF